MKKEFTKKYQLWLYSEGNSFYFEEYDTIEEVIAAQKYGDWYMTKRVELEFRDTDI